MQVGETAQAAQEFSFRIPSGAQWYCQWLTSVLWCWSECEQNRFTIHQRHSRNASCENCDCCLFFLHHMVDIFRGSQWSPGQRSVCCMLILKESLRSLPLRINGKSLQSLESVQKGVSTATEPPFPSVPLRLSLYFPPSLGVMCKCVVSSFQDLRSVTHVDVMIIITFMDTSKCFTYWTLFEPYIKAMSHKSS